MPDYAALKAEIAQSRYAGMSDEQIAAALITQTVPVPVQPVSVASVHGALLLSATGDWLRIEARAAMSYTGGAGDQAISAAKLAIELAASKVENITPENWPGFSAFLAVLVAVGDVAAGTQQAIGVMAQPGVITFPEQIGIPTEASDIEQEIAAARIWPGVAA